MKGVPIKFRGSVWLKGLDPSDINATLEDGDFVYGGYAPLKFLFEDDEGDFIIDNNGTAFLVYPDSVAQLCGYDAYGKEIYEGDELENSMPIYAAIIPCRKVLSPSGGKFYFKGLSDFDIATWNIRLKGDKK